MKKKIKFIMRLHRFFVEFSPEYMGDITGEDTYGYPVYKMSVKQLLYYPVAYVKFMWFSLKGLPKN